MARREALSSSSTTRAAASAVDEGAASLPPGTPQARVASKMPPKRCEHGRVRYFCKECGGDGICEHGRQRGSCKDCAAGRRDIDAIYAAAMRKEARDQRL